MGSSRGDSSWRPAAPSGRRKFIIGSGRLTPGYVLLILLTNALISLFISIIVFMVLSRMTRPESVPSSVQQTALVRSSPGTTATRPAGEPAQTPVEPSGTEGRPDVYVVRAGDNLSAIATRFGVTMDELMAANGLKNPDWIEVGQTLNVPKPGAPPPTSTVPPIPTLTETSLPFEPPTPVPTRTPSVSATVQTPVQSPTSLPEEATSAPSSQTVVIDRIVGAGDLGTELVVILNRGRAVNLEGWTLSDKGGNTYTFPNVLLLSDQASLRIHSGKGKDTPTNLYWSRTEPVWGDAGEVATLKDAQGQVVATYRP